MSKRSVAGQAVMFCGIDVSAATLAAAVQPESQEGFQQREFANSATGHKALIAWLYKLGATARVSLEATGIYSLDLALALDGAEGIEVAVLNPRRVHQFAQTLGRSKTDRADALALAEYSRRMPLVGWRRPNRGALELRALSRYIATLTEEHARLHNRLHAAEGSRTTPRCVREDLKRSMSGLRKRLLRLRRQAVSLIGQDPELERKFRSLTGITGIAETSAVQLLGELASLDPEMSVRQWVAHSGLDPDLRRLGPSAVADQPPRQPLSPPCALHARSGRGPLRSRHEGLLPTAPDPPQDQTPGTDGRRPQTAPRHLRHLQNKHTLRRKQTLPNSPSHLKRNIPSRHP